MKFNKIILFGLVTHSKISDFLSIADAPKICGECWCINGDDPCPEYVEGLNTEINVTIRDNLRKMKLVGEYPKLRTEDGERCSPFASDVGVLNNYPESEFALCEPPKNHDLADAVCAHKYDAETVEGFCVEYTMQTYESEEKALEDGAIVTHYGHCGVCSSAQDLAAYGEPVGEAELKAELCSIAHITKQNVDTDGAFEDLKECYMEKLGYTSECALLWSHYTAASTNPATCLQICADGRLTPNPAPNSGDPPLCPLSDCLNCTESYTRESFNLFSGRTHENSGVINSIARSCEVYNPVVHDAPMGGSDCHPTSGCSCFFSRWLFSFVAVVGSVLSLF